MEFKIDRDVLLKSLAHVQGVVEKKNTLPILGNVLIEAHDGFLKLKTSSPARAGAVISKPRMIAVEITFFIDRS